MKKLLGILVLGLLWCDNLAFADPKMELGLEVFNNKAQCSMCHTLKAAKSIGEIGSNLDQLKPQKNQIVYAVTNGTGVMPSFEGMLSVEEIEAVAHFVSISTDQ